MEFQSDKKPLLAGCRRALAPIVRYLIKGGISWKEFSELSKSVYVQVATSDFGLRGRPTNLSRVAILTGLDRRDVRKQREVLAGEGPIAAGYMTKASQVLGAWHQDPAYLDASGQPQALTIEGSGPTATDLIRQYAPGLPAIAMLKELKSAGAVEERPKGTYRPLMRSYIPKHMPEEQVRLWSSSIRDLASAVGYNFTRQPKAPALFERRAVNVNVDVTALPEFRAFMESEGQAFLERVDDWLAAHAQRPGNTEGATMRLGVGVYQIQDNPGDR